MPSGTRHLQLELIFLPGFLAGLHFMNADWSSLIVFGLSYLFSSLMLSPDLDLRSNSARRRWGILGFIWIPYTKLFKHRGLSHNLLFGPLTRVGYLLLFVTLIMYGLSYLGVRTNIPLHFDKELLVMIALGLYLPNFLHVLYDKLDSQVLRRLWH